MLQTRKSNPNQPPRVVIYGVEGVGKSTLGAKAEKPVFISPEGGTDHLRTASGDHVDEITGVDSWTALRTRIRELTNEHHDFKTLVIDSADWVEGLCHKEILGNTKKSMTTIDGGYNAGFRRAQVMHQELIADLSELREKRGMAIIVTAHAHTKEQKDPQMPHDYDSFEIKCQEMVSSLWREWVDALLFARFKTYTSSSEETRKARALSDGSRVVYTVKQPFCQAKNRYGLPSEMDFTENYWMDFMNFARKGIVEETIDQLRNELTEKANSLADVKTKQAALQYIQQATTKQDLLATRNRLNQIA